MVDYEYDLVCVRAQTLSLPSTGRTKEWKHCVFEIMWLMSFAERALSQPLFGAVKCCTVNMFGEARPVDF